MNPRVSLVLRWLTLLAGTFAVWGVGLLVGRYLVPRLYGFDKALSAGLNPDAYLPVADEVFRAITDHLNLILGLPIFSLGIAIGLYRLAQFERRRALLWSGVACVLWWAFIGLLAAAFDEAPPALVLGLAALAPGLILLGALPSHLFPVLDPKRWISGLLGAELVIVFGLWAAQLIFWNRELPGANFVMLPLLLATLVTAVWLFHRWEDPALRRYVRVFWLVLLCVFLTDRVTSDLKDTIARPRPLAEAHSPWNETLRPIPEEVLRGHSSYPSGHTSGTFALITPLFWWLRDYRLRGALLGAGVLQAVSRIYTVAHFTMDCLTGAIIAFAIGTMVFYLLGGPKQRPPQVSP